MTSSWSLILQLAQSLLGSRRSRNLNKKSTWYLSVSFTTLVTTNLTLLKLCRVQFIPLILLITAQWSHVCVGVLVSTFETLTLVWICDLRRVHCLYPVWLMNKCGAMLEWQLTVAHRSTLITCFIDTLPDTKTICTTEEWNRSNVVRSRDYRPRICMIHRNRIRLNWP